MWSDSRVQERASRFVASADEVWRLQRGGDPECLFFQRAVNGGKAIEDNGSRQGIWTFTPQGELLSQINSLNPDSVLRVLDAALDKWAALPPEERSEAGAPVLRTEHRWEHSAPNSGLILERYVRDVDATMDPSLSPLRPWNKDFAWFTAKEARSWLSQDPQPGDRHAVPAACLQRLVQFHLVDNVRGQTIPYATEEIESMELESTVLSRDGDLVKLSLRGSTEAVSDGQWKLGKNLWTPRREDPHGLRTRLEGRGVFDLVSGRFQELELVALGRRFGRTVMNGRRNDMGAGALGFYFRLAPERPRIAPTFVALYDVPWIELPTKGRELQRD